MIRNYINLVCWEITPKLDVMSNQFYIDSMSMCYMARFFNYKFQKISGTSEYKRLLNDGTMDVSVRLIASANDRHGEFDYELDYRDFSTDQIQDIVEFIQRSGKRHVVIGISSPTQNILAQRLFRELPYLEIYCLGAACSISRQKYDKDRINLFTFLISSPKRTIFKLWLTLKVIFKLFFYEDYKKSFEIELNKYHNPVSL